MLMRLDVCDVSIFLSPLNDSIYSFMQSLGIYNVYDDSIELCQLGLADPPLTEFSKGVFIINKKERHSPRKFLRFEHKNTNLIRDKEKLSKLLLSGSVFYIELSNRILLSSSLESALFEFNNNDIYKLKI